MFRKDLLSSKRKPFFPKYQMHQGHVIFYNIRTYTYWSFRNEKMELPSVLDINHKLFFSHFSENGHWLHKVMQGGQNYFRKTVVKYQMNKTEKTWL